MPIIVKNTFLEEAKEVRPRLRSHSADHSVTTQEELRTVMLRNIPNKYNRRRLEEVLRQHGNFYFENIHVPVDSYSTCNLGYAFVNFKSQLEAEIFMKKIDGAKLPANRSTKICRTCWANRQNYNRKS